MNDDAEIVETSTPEELNATEELKIADGEGGEIDLDLLMGVPVHLTVEIGRKKMTIKELTRLHSGDVIPFDRSVTDPMDIMVNGTLIARGEVVSSEGQLGLRVVDIMTPTERLKQLG